MADGLAAHVEENGPLVKKVLLLDGHPWPLPAATDTAALREKVQRAMMERVGMLPVMVMLGESETELAVNAIRLTTAAVVEDDAALQHLRFAEAFAGAASTRAAEARSSGGVKMRYPS